MSGVHSFECRREITGRFSITRVNKRYRPFVLISIAVRLKKRSGGEKLAINSNSLSGTRQVLIFPLFDYTSDAQIKLPTACEGGRRLGTLAAGEF